MDIALEEMKASGEKTMQGFKTFKPSLAILLTLSIGGCTNTARQQHPLFGEWSIRLERVPSPTNPASHRIVSGRIVFDERLFLNYHGPGTPPEGSVFGRSRIEIENFDESRAGTSVSQRLEDQDQAAEVFGRKIGADSIYFEMAPQIIGSDPVFRGRLSSDTIRGTWVVVAHVDTLVGGTFTMWRAPKSAFADSAVQAAREVARRYKERSE